MTWPAAFYLAEWALEHTEVFQGRKVIELGSGVGFTGLVISLLCHPHQFVFTDCHDDVIGVLRENIAINVTCKTHVCGGVMDTKVVEGSNRNNQDLDCTCTSEDPGKPDCKSSRDSHILRYDRNRSPCTNSCFCDTSRTHDDLHGHERHMTMRQCENVIQHSQTSVGNVLGMSDAVCGRSPVSDMCHVLCLDWSTITAEELRDDIGCDVDVIIAADVVYDISIVSSLVRVLKQLLTVADPHFSRQSRVAYICSTLRNPDTRQQFLDECNIAGLSFSVEEGLPPRPVFDYDRRTPIDIIRLCILDN